MTRRSIRILVIVVLLALAATAAAPALSVRAIGGTFDLGNVSSGYVTVYYMGTGADALKIGVKDSGGEQYIAYRSGTRASISLPAAGGPITISLYKQIADKSYQRIEQVSFTAKGEKAVQSVQMMSSSTKVPVIAEEVQSVQVKSSSTKTPAAATVQSVQSSPAKAPDAAIKEDPSVEVESLIMEPEAAEDATETHLTAVPDEYRRYLNSVKEISFQDGDNVSKKAAQLVAGKGTTEKKAMAIYSYIVKNFSYDWDLYNKVVSGQVTRYTPDPSRILPSKKGICYDIASLYAAMCRSVGIPAKMVKGNSRAAGGYHAWNSVYDDAAGNWVALDLTLNLGGRTSSSWRSIGSGYSASSEV